jgi:two-component system phosphate regulon response regulator PhoB/two-component system alkaline phosphatase synthesis response regulator PhoP
VEDEEDISELVSIHLEKSGFKSRAFSSAKKLFSYLKKQKPDLIILDLMLPDMDGFEVCKELKKNEKYASIPVIMLTAKGEETDKIVGLELGADDYVTKPFSPKELVARVKVVLRRQSYKQDFAKITVGGSIIIDLDGFSVLAGGKKVELTTTEFRILELLASNKGKIFSRDSLLNHLWGQDKIVVDRTIDVHIRHLRGKLGNFAKVIKNVRGMGYKIEE